MKKLIIFESILILFLTFTFGASKSKSATLLGIGTWDCGETYDNYQKGDMVKNTIDQFILGYMTATLIENRKQIKNSNKAIVSDVLNHCKNNPLDMLWVAIWGTYLKSSIEFEN